MEGKQSSPISHWELTPSQGRMHTMDIASAAKRSHDDPRASCALKKKTFVDVCFIETQLILSRHMHQLNKFYNSY